MKKKDLFIGLIIIFVLLLLDQISKVIINNTMQVGESIPIIGSFFKFLYVQNTGAAWSLFDGYKVFLLVISIFSICFFIYLYKDISFSNKKTYSISLSIMIAGALGNFIDRLLFGYVRDFIDFFGTAFPVFNVADMCLVIGIIIFAFDVIILDYKKGVKNGKNQS